VWGTDVKKRKELDVPVASQRRRQLLDAARACIAEEGADKTSLRKVAERAGFSHGTIGYYFKDRKELIDEALREMARSYLQALHDEQESPYGPNGAQALCNLIDSFVQRNAEGAGFVVQMIDIGLHNQDLRDVHHEILQYGWQLIEDMIRAGIESGEFRDDLDPALAARLVHSVMIWWGSELGSAATSPEQAWEVGRLSVDLLKPDGKAATGKKSPPPKPVETPRPSTLEIVRSAVLSDRDMDANTAKTFLAAFENMYALAVGDLDTSKAASGDQPQDRSK
jgi:TetR/AcrR family fatty acid metabolism transcriptional regulator